MTVLEVEDIKKIYRPRFGGNQVQALSKVTFSVEEESMYRSWGRAVQERQHF